MLRDKRCPTALFSLFHSFVSLDSHRSATDGVYTSFHGSILDIMRASVPLLIASAAFALAAPSPKILPLKGLIRNRPAPADLLAQIETIKVASLAVENSTESEEVTAPYKNVWASLTTAEAAQVVSFLHNQTELNLTAAADADSYVLGPFASVEPGIGFFACSAPTLFPFSNSWSNWAGAIDLAPPNKTDVLDWIDGKASEPPRFAKVILQCEFEGSIALFARIKSFPS